MPVEEHLPAQARKDEAIGDDAATRLLQRLNLEIAHRAEPQAAVFGPDQLGIGLPLANPHGRPALGKVPDPLGKGDFGPEGDRSFKPLLDRIPAVPAGKVRDQVPDLVGRGADADTALDTGDVHRLDLPRL